MGPVLRRVAGSAIRLLWGTAQTLLSPVVGRRRGSFPVVLSTSGPLEFPDPAGAPPEGLIAVGGDLSVERLLAAYRRGVFPWYGEDTPILWWSPDPRAIFELDGLRVSRRLARTVRSGRFRFTIDAAFVEVVRGCSQREEGTWITPEMLAAYEELHRLGHAHSLEVWCGDELAGGVYGVSQGGLFAGESMFSRVRDASKVALVHLTEHLRQRGCTLFDVQYLNPHTQSLGAVEIPRAEYLRRLAKALRVETRFT